jgi:type II secretory ATPase GspE/PulE/Tfp pilus assembly ATPase PilB-like protein
MLDLGIPGYLISSSVSAILAQRLVRKLCSCHKVRPATEEFRSQFAQVGGIKPPATMSVPIGCERCDQTGYSGRVGIYELLHLDESIRTVIRTTGNIDQVRTIARANGLHLMLEDALEKLRLGTTTMEEIFRVVPTETAGSHQAECAKCAGRVLPAFKFCPYCGIKNATATAESRSTKLRSQEEEVLQ